MTPLCWGIVIVVVVGIAFVAYCCCAVSGFCSDEEVMLMTDKWQAIPENRAMSGICDEEERRD